MIKSRFIHKITSIKEVSRVLKMFLDPDYLKQKVMSLPTAYWLVLNFWRETLKAWSKL